MTEENIERQAKEKAEENYTKVYLQGDMSLDTEEKYFAYTKGYCKGYTDGFAEGRKESDQFIIFHNKEEMEILRNLLDEECNKGTVDTVIWNLRSRLNTRLIRTKE